MAKRGRPVSGENSDNKQNKITVVFAEKELALFERLNKLAYDSDKAVAEIIRNILKIGIECYGLGYNVGFDGKLIKSEVSVEQCIKPAENKTSIKDELLDSLTKKKESVFIS
ncbi:MAG: hypothetical protein K2P99_00670 [Burkholderiales bacterium]|nr:hypothetical protein [Burkholderiales bacterium]